MEYDILYRPSYSLAVVSLRRSEEIVVEAGAMVSMSPGIQIETKARGGILGGLARSFLGGESFFLNTFKAEEPGEVTLAPSLPGDVVHLELKDETLLVQSGSYMACSSDISVDTTWGGAKTFFSKEGFFLLKLEGRGDLFLSSYGAIHEKELKNGERYIVDTGHMVAFDQGVGYQVTRVGGLKSTLFSGEGLVVELTGPGRIYIQSRSTDAFLSWLIPLLPSRR
ncbi:MAG: TIGR00266 family protein [Dehalococcoidia bacterium]